MSSVPNREQPGDPRDRTAMPGVRRRTFRVIAVIMAVSAVAFGLFTAVGGIVSETQEIHAFHNVVVASLLLVLSAPPAIVAARAPERAAAPLAHLVVLGVAGLITMALGLRIDVFTLPFIVLVAVLLLLRVARGPALAPGSPSPALVVLVVVAAVPLLMYALGQAELQRTDTSSEHAEFNHWVEVSFYAMAILSLGILAALRPTAYRLTVRSAGAALVILGGASILLQDYASAIDIPWAWAALVGGLVFIAVAEWEGRARGHPDLAVAESR
jgi:hypothetical protein